MRIENSSMDGSSYSMLDAVGQHGRAAVSPVPKAHEWRAALLEHDRPSQQVRAHLPYRNVQDYNSPSHASFPGVCTSEARDAPLTELAGPTGSGASQHGAQCHSECCGSAASSYPMRPTRKKTGRSAAERGGHPWCWCARVMDMRSQCELFRTTSMLQTPCSDARALRPLKHRALCSALLQCPGTGIQSHARFSCRRSAM